MTPGHAFVVQGDLTQLVCDEVLIPTDRWLDVGEHWDALQPLRDSSRLPSGWSTGTTRVTDRLSPVDGLPARRMVNSGARASDPVEWLLVSIDQALAAAVAGLRGERSAHGRSRPLLALPALGTGAGGYAERRGEVLDELLERCRQAAEASGVDIVVVCRSRSDFTALQARRRRRPAQDLGALAQRLGRHARAGELALFLGAGVSMGAGLPGWASLLTTVADSDDVTRPLLDGWRERDADLWQRASDLEERLGTVGMAAAVRTVLSRSRFGLAHALLASLPSREVVTTNFDGLFESARSVRAVPSMTTLPYVRGSEAYLLKLHGDAELGDVVFTRQSLEGYDEDRRPLAGLLQGLLLTRHVLFVGCSMTDENVERNVDQVAALIRRHAQGPDVGTVLLMSADLDVMSRWRAKGFHVEALSESGGAEAARDLEVLLDEVLLHATFDEGGHLLDGKYEALVPRADREATRLLREAVRVLPGGPEWDGLRLALRAYGADLPDDVRPGPAPSGPVAQSAG